MKQTIFLLVALAATVCLLAAAMSPAYAWTNPLHAQSPVLAQSADPQPSPQEQASPEGQAAPQGQGGPQGSGLRGFLPLILVVGLYLLLRRTFRNMGNRLEDDEERGPGDPWRNDFPRDAGPGDEPESIKDAYDNARRTWGTFTSSPGQDTPAGEPRPVVEPPEQVSGDESLSDEDRDFLEGARMAFVTITEAMDRLDLDTVEQLAAPEVVNRVKLRLNAEEQPVESEIDHVDARILERSREEGVKAVAVRFDATRRTPQGQGRIHEIWHFTRNAEDPQSHWTLLSVQAVEE